MNGILDGSSDESTKPTRSERRATKRAQRDLIEGPERNRSLTKLIVFVVILVGLVLISVTFNWWVSGERQKSYREGQNHPNEKVAQKICTEAYTVGVDGRSEPAAVASTRDNNLTVNGEWCDYSAIPIPPTTKATAKQSASVFPNHNTPPFRRGVSPLTQPVLIRQLPDDKSGFEQ